MLTVKAAAVQVAHMERAGRGEVVVPGASWMVFGESFIGEHQRMLDTLQTSDAAKMDDESHGAEKHAHMVQLTLLSWLQPDAGVVALRALLGSRRAAKLFKTFLTRACPRLLPSLDELMKVLRNGAVAEINFSDPRHQGVPSQKTATRSSEATDGALRGQLTLHELLDKEMLLAWTEFLASDECAGHIVTRLRLPGTSVAAPPPGTFNALMQAMNGLLLLSETSTGSSTWLSMFTNATSKLVHAVLVVDVRVAGLPLVYVNDAFERLTGYTPVEAVGQNCRFLQGDATEAEAVAELAHAIRERRSCVVKITNYHKSGTAFANELSLHPVCDSRGVYHYMIGVASDAGDSSNASERAMLVAMRQLLPSQFPSSLSVRIERRIRSFDVLNSQLQYEDAALQLARVTCCHNRRGALKKLLEHPAAAQCVHDALPENESRFRCVLP